MSPAAATPPDVGFIGTGQACGNARLTNEQAREMRVLRAAGWSQHDLGILFGVDRVTVLGIVKGRTYPDAGGPVEPPGRSRPFPSILG